MINILIPLAGSKNGFFPDELYPYPVPLIEFCGKSMIEHVISNYDAIEQKQFIFIVNESDCMKYHLDNVLKLLTDNKCIIIKLDKSTKGAACSALMAIESINNEFPLVVANADQIIDVDINQTFKILMNYDAGVIVFNSVHPRWSYVRLDEKNNVVESAEKRPISKHAIAGFYYFRSGCDFVSATMQMILKDAHVNDQFFIAPVLNELILESKNIGIYSLDIKHYHTFYTPQKIEEFERLLQC